MYQRHDILISLTNTYIGDREGLSSLPPAEFWKELCRGLQRHRKPSSSAGATGGHPAFWRCGCASPGVVGPLGFAVLELRHAVRCTEG